MISLDPDKTRQIVRPDLDLNHFKHYDSKTSSFFFSKMIAKLLNKMSKDTKHTSKRLAFKTHDTYIQKCLGDYEAFKVINEDLLKLSLYGSQWLISLNALKTEYIIVSKRKTRGRHSDLFLNDIKITEANHHKISNTMSWTYHINEILAKAEKRLSIMQRSKHILPRSCLDKLRGGFNM